MANKQTYTVLGIVVLAGLAAVALTHGFAWIFIQAAWDDMPLVGREVPVTTVLGYGLAALGAVFAIKHPRTFTLANEVVEELSKVTWPTREETSNATVVVIVTVVVCSVYLGVFDAVWLWVTSWMLGINHAATPG
jgi:preprotein translocase subunit SecE